MRHTICRQQTTLPQASAGLIEPDRVPGLSLLENPIEAAYPVGVTEEPYAHFATWVGWPVQEPETMVVFYELGRPLVAFCMGRPAGIEAIFQAASDLPPTLYAVCPHGHLPKLERWYTFDKVTEKLRMALTLHETSGFRLQASGRNTEPQPCSLKSVACSLPVERLGPADLREIVALLKSEDMRPDVAQLHQGRYFGVRLPAGGGLVSVAAAHLVSYRRRMALVGNFVTRSDQRGRGFATAAILRLLDELRPEIHSICLDVDIANEPAVKLYETLGFAPRSRHLEVIGRRIY